MSADRLPPRPPVAPAPEWVGDGESRINVAGWQPHALALRALDTVLREHEFIRQFKAGVHLELQLIKDALGIGSGPRVAGSYRDPDASSHDWSEEIARADAILRQRVKDPGDKMTSERARAIAKEVVDQVANAKDAAAYRAQRTTDQARSWSRKDQIIAGLVVTFAGLAAGLLTGHFGWH